MVGRELCVDELKSEIEVSDDSEKYFSDESDTKSFDSVAHDENLDNSATLFLTMLGHNFKKNWLLLQFYLHFLEA